MGNSTEVFAKRLKELREERGMSLEDLAKYVKLSKTTLNKYELKLRDPMFPNVIKIAEFFNVDINWLTGFSEERNPVINQKELSKIFMKLPDAQKQELFNFANYLLTREEYKDGDNTI